MIDDNGLIIPVRYYRDSADIRFLFWGHGAPFTRSVWVHEREFRRVSAEYCRMVAGLFIRAPIHWQWPSRHSQLLAAQAQKLGGEGRNRAPSVLLTTEIAMVFRLIKHYPPLPRTTHSPHLCWQFRWQSICYAKPRCRRWSGQARNLHRARRGQLWLPVLTRSGDQPEKHHRNYRRRQRAEE